MPAQMAVSEKPMAWNRAGLLMAAVSLTGFGLIMVYSASVVRATRGGGWELSYASNQFTWLIIAVITLSIFAAIPYQWIAKLRWAILLSSYAAAAIVISPLGTRVNGASRWLRIGPINIQASELVKIGMVTAIAAFLAQLQDGRPRFFRHVIPLCIASALAVGLIAKEPDFGTATLIACTLGCLMLAGGVRIWQLFILAAPTIPIGAWYGYSKFEYIRERIHDWLAGNAFHTNVSMLAIGSGGTWGVGLGQGPAKLDYLPEAHTDFIFALVGQETGLVGSAALILLFIMLVWQGMAIARNARDRFGSLLAYGITTVIGGQALFNMGVVTGLLPPKGISLPFVSFGGSGLVIFYTMIGIMISISRARPEKIRAKKQKQAYTPITPFSGVTATLNQEENTL